jgi:hypothetical protein
LNGPAHALPVLLLFRAVGWSGIGDDDVGALRLLFLENSWATGVAQVAQSAHTGLKDHVPQKRAQARLRFLMHTMFH